MPLNIQGALEAAHAYVKLGFHVVPIPYGQKHPVLNDWPMLRLTQDDLSRYFRDDGSNIGLLYSAPLGLVDVDVDCDAAMVIADAFLPSTGMVHGRLSKRRSHFWYIAAPTIESSKFEDPDRTRINGADRATLIEIRSGSGLQTVVPPSRHVSGEEIRWDSTAEPNEVNADDLQRAVASIAVCALLAPRWTPGRRHDISLPLAGMLLRAGWGTEETERLFLGIARAAHDEEFADRLRSLMSTAQRLIADEPCTGAPKLADILGENVVSRIRRWLRLPSGISVARSELHFHLTDVGNAKRLVDKIGQNVRYCYPWNKWLVWNGSRWALDEVGEVERMAKDTIQAVYSDATNSIDHEARRELAKHALRSEAEHRIKAMVNLARSETGIPVTPNELDADPLLLNCLNGTLNLQTGNLFPHRREDLCFKQVPVVYDSAAACPTWESFLHRIMAGNSSLVEFLQRAVGYSLTGLTNEQVLFLFYGTGANGKTTFVETNRMLLGDYAQQADFDTFLAGKNEGGPRNDIARLKGTRFVSAVEAGQGRKLAETVIKQVTGGDKITARFLYQEFFEFSPQFKLFLAANYKPNVAGTEEAIWRRVRLIPFNVKIPPEERDKLLLAKLQRELPGILAWAVRGCLKWQENGLAVPHEVSEATAQYRIEEDFLAGFIADCCLREERGFVAAGSLYQVYENWCSENGEQPATKKCFGSELHSRGFVPGKKGGRRCWFGIRLRTENDVD